MKTGSSPTPSKYFKKTPRGLLVHSSISAMQFVLGICIIIAIPGALIELLEALKETAAKDGWTPEIIDQVQVAFVVMDALIALAGLFLMTTFREVWLDESLSRVMVRTRFFLIGRTKIYARERVKAVRLEPRFHGVPGKRHPYWNFCLEMMDGNAIPLIMKVFSDQANTFASEKDTYKLSADFPRRAWILSSTFGVPLHFVYGTADTYIKSIDEVPKFSEDEKEEMKSEHKKTTEKNRKEFNKISKRYGIAIGICLLVMVGAMIWSVFERGRITRVHLILLLGGIAQVVILGPLIYYFWRRMNSDK